MHRFTLTFSLDIVFVQNYVTFVLQRHCGITREQEKTFIMVTYKLRHARCPGNEKHARRQSVVSCMAGRPLEFAVGEWSVFGHEEMNVDIL